MKNKEISKLLYEIADLLSLADENPFKVRAYEKSAQVIESLPEPIEKLIPAGEKIPGVGESISNKIKEYLNTNKISYLEDLRRKFPPGLLKIMEIPGMGPKKAKAIYDNFKISTIEDLKKYAQEGRLRGLAGFGPKLEENIIKSIELAEKLKGRILLFDALNIAKLIVDELLSVGVVKQIAPAGSLRRGKETIGDIDILTTVKRGEERKIIDKFVNLSIVDRVLLAGTTKATIVSHDGVQIDLRVLEPSSYGAALQYFTGSKEHNILLRDLANKKRLTISEYGVFRLSNRKQQIAGRKEEEVYTILGLDFIPPELREGRGEIEAAKARKLPNLIELTDLKGDIHVHSKYSDGADTLEEIAEKARQVGLEWVIICDHSKSLKVAGGVSIKDLKRKKEEIDEFNRRSKDVKLIMGAEVDILPDGSLDYPDDVLENIDFVIAAIHTGFKQSEEQITNRIINSMRNKYVHSVAHPSGRLLGKRDPYKVNIERILESASETNSILEINAFPERLDLNDIYSKKAKEMGIILGIGTDAHTVSHFDYLNLGVYVARRAWLEKDDLLNTLSYTQLMKRLREIRKSKG